MSAKAILNYLRLNQGPLMALALLAAGMVLLAALLSQQWLVSAGVFAPTAVDMAGCSRRGSIRVNPPC